MFPRLVFDKTSRYDEKVSFHDDLRCKMRVSLSQAQKVVLIKRKVVAAFCDQKILETVEKPTANLSSQPENLFQQICPC